MYVIPISVVIAVLVFATMAVAQSVPEGQEPSQTASDANTSGVQNSTTVPPKKEPAKTTTPAETATPAESSASATDTISDTDAIVGVDIDDHAFDPAQRNIAPGTRVMFINNDTEPHTATADNGLFDTGELEPGESSWVSFEGAGTVTYHCELHPDMQGSIVVGQADAPSGTEGTNPPNQSAEVVPSVPPTSEATEAAQPVSGY